jgi:hypothetical protein
MRPVVALAFAVLFALPAFAKPPKRVLEQVDDAFAELDHDCTLRFVDAVTGKPVEGAQVTLGEDTRKTDAEGAVKFPFPDDLTAGDDVRTIEFKRKGYVTAKLKVPFVARTLFFNRFSVSPALAPGLVRIVLEWDKAPADLDAHLVKESGWHISFHDMRKYQDLAWLDRDAMQGLGPETITVARFDPEATYRFFVHDFTSAVTRKPSELGQSRARVRLFTEAGLWREFSVSPSLEGGKWSVFDIVKGEVATGR